MSQVGRSNSGCNGLIRCVIALVYISIHAPIHLHTCPQTLATTHRAPNHQLIHGPIQATTSQPCNHSSCSCGLHFKDPSELQSSLLGFWKTHPLCKSKGALSIELLLHAEPNDPWPSSASPATKHENMHWTMRSSLGLRLLKQCRNLHLGTGLPPLLLLPQLLCILLAA